MASFGSGLSAQFGYKAETTVGTAVTVDRFQEMLGGETLGYTPTILDGQGLRAGQAIQRASRSQISRHSVAGDLPPLEFGDRGGMGLLIKHMLGSTITVPTQIGATTAWKQNHHWNTSATQDGLGLTVQIGRPQTDTAVRAHTYNGVKIVSWEFSCSDNQYAQLKLTADGWNESTATALATASYAASVQPFTFADAATFKIGGTASTTTGETTVAGGVAITTLVRGITITGTFPKATERYGLGNAGVKKEQVQNGIPEVTATLEAEYTQRTEFYDLLKTYSSSALELVFSHGDAGSSNPFALSFIMPAFKVREGGPQVAGPDIVAQTIGIKAYDDGSGTNPALQVRLVSTDTTLTA